MKTTSSISASANSEEKLLNQSILTSEEYEKGLEKISKIILQEGKNLIPHRYDLGKLEASRLDDLWRLYSRTGVFLSRGGVDKSLFNTSEISNNSNLQTFNDYRSDRSQSTTIRQDELKEFLVEEGILGENTDLNQIFVAHSLGSHEAFTRICRCLRNEENSGIIFPKGSYGLLSRAISAVEPSFASYNIFLADIDRNNGDKISTESIRKITKRNPHTKTLYLDLKTIAGSIYKSQELEEIVKICKENDLFLIFDSAHINMDFSQIQNKEFQNPNLSEICQKLNHHKYAIIFTGSKTYGLERARVGMVVLNSEEMHRKIQQNFLKTIGSFPDIPFDATKQLISTPLDKRKEFLDEQRQRHFHNLNLMIGYIEGINSPNIHPTLQFDVAEEIPTEFHQGIAGIKIQHLPESGIQLKIDTSDLQNKYFGNVRMFNSEILSYALHSATAVTTLNSHQIMDDSGFAMRLSFSSRNDVHQGMQLFARFVNSLSPTPQPNPYLNNINPESLIFPSSEEIEKVVEQSYQLSESEKLALTNFYEEKAQQMAPKFAQNVGENKTKIVHNAAKMIQKNWREFVEKNSESSENIEEIIQERADHKKRKFSEVAELEEDSEEEKPKSR